jgi:hypothetical protein
MIITLENSIIGIQKFDIHKDLKIVMQKDLERKKINEK